MATVQPRPMENQAAHTPQVYERPSSLTRNRAAVAAATIAVIVLAALVIWWIASAV